MTATQTAAPATPTTGAAPHHDNLTCYTVYRCRRPECVDRYNARNRERRRAHRTGTYDVFIDAEPVRRHILRLQRAGMSLHGIAGSAGMTVQSVLEFTHTLPARGRGRRQRTTPATAAKILAVSLTNRTVGTTDATGTRRRIQALVAIGWPVRHIARHAGLSGVNAADFLSRSRVYVATANAVAAAYDDLRAQRPGRSGVTKSHEQAAKSRAARLNWPPPKYWNSNPGAIDDPEFVPEYGKTRAQVIAEEAAWLMGECGHDAEAAAERIGITLRHLERVLAEADSAPAEAVA